MLNGHHLLPQGLVVLGYRLPALPAISQSMSGHFLAPEVVDGEFTIQADADVHPLSTTLCWHTVAVAMDIDVGVPANVPDVVVSGIEVLSRPGQELGQLLLEPLRRGLPEPPKHPLLRVGVQPVLQQLVQVRVAVEAAIALEEVVLHVTHHALGLALGSGPLGPAGPGGKAIMVSQLQEASIEGNLAIAVVANHGGLLVVHQNAGRDTAKVPEGLQQRLIGVFCILARTGPDVEVPGVAEDIDGEIDGTEPAAHLRPDLAPVVLELLARKRLVPDGSLAGPQGSFGLNVLTNEGG